MNFKKIHQEILKKSSKFKIVKNEIEKNGIIKIQKSRLDLFSFITKNIISQQISSIQLNQIFQITLELQKKFLLKKQPVVISGIGQDVLYNYFKKKKLETFYFKQFLNKSRLIKEASFHAPAVSIALLLQRLK